MIYLLAVGCSRSKKSNWEVQDIVYQARDGLKIRAYLLKPVIVKKKYPVVVCIHHAWGNRDDYLKLFPSLANAGVIALSPELERHKPGFKKERFQDITDSIDFIENLPFTDKTGIGIITSSLSVNTGAIAITNKWNVKAFVMLSGPIIMENQRKMLTINTDMAIFPIVSKYEGNNYQLMREYIVRNINPKSRFLVLDNKEKKFKVEEHGTYLFDTHPEIINMIENFLIDAFEIANQENGIIKNLIPLNAVEFRSTDGLSIFATFYSPRRKEADTVLLLPPRYKSRLYYEDVATELNKLGLGVMAMNNKRTCRYSDEEFLCDREIKGALKFLTENNKIKKEKIIIVAPSAYFIAVKKLIEQNELNIKKIIFVGKPDPNAYFNPEDLKSKYRNIVYAKSSNKRNLISMITDKDE